MCTVLPCLSSTLLPGFFVLLRADDQGDPELMFSQQPSPSAVIFTGHLVDCGKHTHTHKRELQGYLQVSELVKEGFIRAVG